MSVSVKFEGNKKLAKELAKRGKLREVKEAVRAGGREMERTAKQKVPKKTGKLQSSITSSNSDFRYELKAGEKYAQYVEFGTKKHGKAQPFMRPAQESGAKKFHRELDKLVR